MSLLWSILGQAARWYGRRFPFVFAMAGAVSVPGISAREIPDEELLKGFGDDSHR